MSFKKYNVLYVVVGLFFANPYKTLSMDKKVVTMITFNSSLNLSNNDKKHIENEFKLKISNCIDPEASVKKYTIIFEDVSTLFQCSCINQADSSSYYYLSPAFSALSSMFQLSIDGKQYVKEIYLNAILNGNNLNSLTLALGIKQNTIHRGDFTINNCSNVFNLCLNDKDTINKISGHYILMTMIAIAFFIEAGEFFNNSLLLETNRRSPTDAHACVVLLVLGGFCFNFLD